MSHKKYTLVQKASHLARWKILRRRGLSQGAAAREIGVALNTLKSWADPQKNKVPRRMGRPRALDLNETETQVFQEALLKFESVPLAAEQLMTNDDARLQTREALGRIFARAAAEGKRLSWPKAIRAASNIPEAVKAAYRGQKHQRDYEPKARRSGTIVMPDGAEVPWYPGCIFESDDMSVNETYRFYDPSLGHETLGRQALFTLDSATDFNLQADMCGRAFDAYRAEDIADHMLAVVETHGLPLCWRLEMGSWASNFVKGIAIDGREERWGALEDLFYVRHKHQSTGKANIERSFHEQQKLTAHKSTSLGRKRGEFEIADKLAPKARKGNPDALRYFWNMDQCANAIAEILSDRNRKKRTFPKLGNVFASPEELFAECDNRVLDDADRWYFLPVKRQARIRKGVIEVKVEHYPRKFRFLTHGTDGFPLVSENYPVLIAFHPGRPHEGCEVFNRATGDQNVHGLSFGQRIGRAEHFRDVPEEDLTGKGDFSQVSKGKAAIRKEMRSIIPAGKGPGTLQSIARDGLGNALEMQKGNSVAGKKGTSPDVSPKAPEKAIHPQSARISRFSGLSPADRAAEIKRLTKQYQEQ